jgi:sec-independent protein translocase protein TatA
MLALGLSPWHIIAILVVALLLFGNRLPEVARSLGRAMNEFKKGLREVGDDVNIDKPEPPPGRIQPPTEPPTPHASTPAATPPSEKHE